MSERSERTTATRAPANRTSTGPGGAQPPRSITWRLTRRNLRGNRRRLIGTALAVILGVAFLAGTMTLADTMRQGIDGLLAHGYARTDVVVRNATTIGSGDLQTRGRLDAALVDRIAALDEVAAVAGDIDGIAQIIAADGEPIGGNGPPTVAGDWTADPRLNPYALAEGRAPNARGEVVIDRRSAIDGGLGVGDTTTVRTPEPIEVTIVGIVTFGDVDSVAGASYVGFTTEQARSVLIGDADEVTSIEVAARDGVTPEALRGAIDAMLPPEAEALTRAEIVAETRADIDADFFGFFETFLLAFAAIALLVATFSIHNTFAILVAQRTREAALLRAIGASRGQVVRMICAEAVAIGLVASGLGLAAGVGLGFGLRALIAAFGVDLPGDGLVVTSTTVVTALAVGTVVTLVASLVPALRAGRVAPLAALRDSAVDRSATSVRRAVLGMVLTAGGIALVITAASGDGSGAGARAGWGALATLVGAVVLGPVVARPAAAVLGTPVAALRGRTGRLARRNAMRNPRRTAASASALMVGTAVVALFTTFAASVRESVAQAVEDTFRGDLVVTEKSFSGAGLPPSLAGELATLPEVGEAVSMGIAPVRAEDARGDTTDVVPILTEPHALAELFALDVTAGAIAAMPADAIAVDEDYAADHGLAVGGTQTFHFSDGTSRAMTVAAIYAVNELADEVLMHRSDWPSGAGAVQDVVVLIRLAPGVGIAQGRAAVDAVSTRLTAPEAQTAQEYVDTVGAQVDQMLGLIYGLLGLAVLIAVMGIANTLSLSIHERTREIGLLRALGQQRRQVRSGVRWEAVIVAVFGTVGGLTLGTFLAWGLVKAIAADAGIGEFAVPAPALGAILGLAALAGVIAAVRPARRAARLDVLAAISGGPVTGRPLTGRPLPGGRGA